MVFDRLFKDPKVVYMDSLGVDFDLQGIQVKSEKKSLHLELLCLAYQQLKINISKILLSQKIKRTVSNSSIS